jgi:propanol-preferring alcohol dehydrogenase
MVDVMTYNIPKTCKAGVVVNEGPDFKLEVEDVPVPEPGRLALPEIRDLCADDT